MIPSVPECFRLMDQYHMLENIRAHSVMVARVAGLIAKALKKQGHTVSLDLTLAGALLHDIAKTASLDNDSNHAEMGRDICRRHNFFEIADIVGEHVLLKNGVPTPCCGEKEIVYYADKRVVHDRVVSLDARLEYIIERYGRNDPWLCERIRMNFKKCRLIEEKLFASLSFSPGGIVDLVDGHPLSLGDFEL